MKHSEAYMNGWHAHEKQVSSDCNPYNEYWQSYSHAQWVSGWCARFEAIKHGKSLELDLEMGF